MGNIQIPGECYVCIPCCHAVTTRTTLCGWTDVDYTETRSDATCPACIGVVVHVQELVKSRGGRVIEATDD